MVGRPFAAVLEPIVKQPVVIETKAGAAGAVGAQFAANAKPDGYTLLVHIVSISGFAEVDKLFGRPPKFTRADFIPIARFTEGPMVLVVNDQTPYKTLKDLVDDAKKRPNEIVFSSSGLYGALHLPAALFMKAAGMQMRHLPTNGGGPALTAILGNNAQVLVTSIAAANAQIKAGKLRALACFSDKRAASLPDVPTMKEQRLRRPVLALGRPVRAQGHAGADRQDAARGQQEGGRHRAVQEGDRQPRRRRRLSRPARLRQVLGRGRQARRGRGPGHRQGLRMAARPDDERSAQRMILRRDHVAGGAFIVAGALVFAMSGDLPFGTLASPGAGMMPKLVLGLLMAFGAILVDARRRKPAARRHHVGRFPPCRDRGRGVRHRHRALHHDRLRAQRVAVAVRAALFHRAPEPLAALAVSIGVTVGSVSPVQHAAEIAAAAHAVLVPEPPWKSRPSTACCSASRSRSSRACCSMRFSAAWSAPWSACCPASARSPASASCCR